MATDDRPRPVFSTAGRFRLMASVDGQIERGDVEYGGQTKGLRTGVTPNAGRPVVSDRRRIIPVQM